MKRKKAQLPAPAYLCSNVLGQQVIYNKRSLHEIHEGPLVGRTNIATSPTVQAALHTAQKNVDTALLDAVQNNCIPQTIARHIAHGANINVICDGLSPLLLAIINRDVEIVAFLLTHGANPSINGPYNNTPLHHIATDITAKTLKIAELLIISGASVNAQNDLGQTPLHLHGAAGEWYKKFARLMIKNGARLDLIDIKGNEPLEKLPEKVKEELLRFALFNLFDR